MFGLLSADEQDDRLATFARVLNGLPWPVQVTLFTKPADVSGDTRQVEQAASQLGDSPLGNLAVAQADLARSLSAGVLAEATVLSVTGKDAQEVTARARRLVTTLDGSGFRASVCGPDRLGDRGAHGVHALLRRVHGWDDERGQTETGSVRRAGGCVGSRCSGDRAAPRPGGPRGSPRLRQSGPGVPSLRQHVRRGPTPPVPWLRFEP